MMRGYASAFVRMPARDFTSEGLTPDHWSLTRNSPGPGSGVAMSMTFSTSRAGPVRSYTAARMGQNLQLFNLGNAIVASNNAKQGTKGVGCFVIRSFRPWRSFAPSQSGVGFNRLCGATVRESARYLKEIEWHVAAGVYR